jgi:hypothetical protein
VPTGTGLAIKMIRVVCESPGHGLAAVEVLLIIGLQEPTGSCLAAEGVICLDLLSLAYLV